MAFSVTIDGDTRVIRALDKIEKGVKDFRPLLGEVGEVLVTDFQKNFPEEGARLGKKWQKLSQGTIRQRKATADCYVPVFLSSL